MGAMELLDDAALLPIKKTGSIVVSTDALVEKIHFHSDERSDFIARRLCELIYPILQQWVPSLLLIIWG